MLAKLMLACLVVGVALNLFIRLHSRRYEEQGHEAQDSAPCDPAQCTHVWIMNGEGVCHEWESNGYAEPAESYKLFYCPSCGSSVFACTHRGMAQLRLTGEDACALCYCMPDCPAELKRCQPVFNPSEEGVPTA